MAILENIRKRTTVMIFIIGMALFAFVLSGIFTGTGVKTGSAVAEVNGEEISIDEFRRNVEAMTRRYGAGATTMQAVNSAWDQKIRSQILSQEFNALGIDIESDQIINVIKTNPAFAQDARFQSEDGLFDEGKFRAFVVDLRTNDPEGAYQSWLLQEKSIIDGAKEQMYFNLVKIGAGATLKEGELDYRLANDKVDVKYVKVPFTSIQDSSITVSKSDITAYINAHQKDFKQETARDLSYVYFQEKASLEDEKAIKDRLASLLEDKDGVVGFGRTTDNENFVDTHSDVKFDSTYVSKSVFPAAYVDTLLNLSIGDVYGPYRVGKFFNLSKMLGKKENGSVKLSHVLISWKGATSAAADITRTKEEAEIKAKEVLAEVKAADADFATIVTDNSDDKYTAPRAGDLGSFQKGQLTKAFEKLDEFAFGNDVDAVELIETEFGYHITKIVEKEDVYQIANIVDEVEASEETLSSIFTNAAKFEMKTSEGTDFATAAKEGNYISRPVNSIKALEENLPGLSAQRVIVQWAFNEDTNIGDVKKFTVNGGYAVVQLTAKIKEGVSSVEEASATVLPILRKQRKAAQIIAANKGKAMDAFASANGVNVTNATALNMKTPTMAGAGREPLVVGTAFGLKEGSTSGFVIGENGVYMLQVTKKTPAAKLENYATYANSLKSLNAGKANAAVYNALKGKATIEDKRAEFY